MNWYRHHIAIVAILLALVPPLFIMGGQTYVSRILITIVLYAILTMALNIVFGHTDQLFLFTGAVAAIGAYTTVLTTQAMGITPWVTLVFGALVAGLAGTLVSYIAAVRNLTVIVISILTISLQFSIIELINSMRDLTGGVTGLTFTGLRLNSIENALGVREHVVLFYVVAGLLVATLVFYRYLMTSRYGLAFEMIRQDETAAESIGINVVKYKTIAGFTAAFIIGLVGPFLAQLTGYVSPGLYSFNNVDVLVLIMLIVGGLRTMYGPLVGAALIVFINQQLRGFAEFRSIVFGLLLMGLFLYFREGILPFVDTQLDRSDIKQRMVNLRGE